MIRHASQAPLIICFFNVIPAYLAVPREPFAAPETALANRWKGRIFNICLWFCEPMSLQKYKWHRLLAYDPNNDCNGVFMDWFLFPSCCACRCRKNPLLAWREGWRWLSVSVGIICISKKGEVLMVESNTHTPGDMLRESSIEEVEAYNFYVESKCIHNFYPALLHTSYCICCTLKHKSFTLGYKDNGDTEKICC